MNPDMMNKLLQASRSAYYWLFLLVTALVVEAVALYFQYVLDEWPCVLCIHVRIWLAALLFVALFGFWARNKNTLSILAYLMVTGIAIGLFERSWILLGVERGTIFGACSMDSGLPAWFALDKWFPLLFEVQASCGYTPELLFGITMAESLFVLSLVLLLLGALPLVLLVWRKFSGK